MTIGEYELRERSASFLAALTQAGFEAHLMEASFRNYLVKVMIRDGQDWGRVAIHYKASRQSFSLTTSELIADAPAQAVQAC